MMKVLLVSTISNLALSYQEACSGIEFWPRAIYHEDGFIEVTSVSFDLICGSINKSAVPNPLTNVVNDDGGEIESSSDPLPFYLLPTDGIFNGYTILNVDEVVDEKWNSFVSCSQSRQDSFALATNNAVHRSSDDLTFYIQFQGGRIHPMTYQLTQINEDVGKISILILDMQNTYVFTVLADQSTEQFQIPNYVPTEAYISSNQIDIMNKDFGTLSTGSKVDFETSINLQEIDISSFHSDTEYFYLESGFLGFFSFPDQQLGNLKAGPTGDQTYVLQFISDQMEFQGSHGFFALLYNSILDKYEAYDLNMQQASTINYRFELPQGVFEISSFFYSSNKAYVSVKLDSYGIATFEGQSFGVGINTVYYKGVGFLVASNTKVGCDPEIYTLAEFNYPDTVFQTAITYTHYQITVNIISDLTIEALTPGTANLDFSEIYYFPGNDCFANTDFDDVTSPDLVAFLDQGVFTLEFPEVYICEDLYEYTVDDFLLVDDQGNNMLSEPLSYSPGGGIHFNADHASVVKGNTLLHATIIDDTSGSEMIDITFSFILFVEDGNEEPTVTTNECLYIVLEQEEEEGCDFLIEDSNQLDELTYTFNPDVAWITMEDGFLRCNPTLMVDSQMYEIEVTATDDNTAGDPEGVKSVTTTIMISVTEVNWPPYVESDCNYLIIFTDEITTCTITALDANPDDVLTSSQEIIHPYLVSYIGDTVTFSPTFDDIGDDWFRFRYEDDNSANHINGVQDYPFYFRIYVQETNYKPEIEVQTCDGLKVDRNERLYCTIQATDKNIGDSLSYSLQTDFDWIEFEEGVIIVHTDSKTEYGTYQIVLRVEDDNTAGYYNSQFIDETFEIQVRSEAFIQTYELAFFIASIFELDEGKIEFTGLVDAAEYSNYFIQVKVQNGLPPEFMTFQEDRLIYQPQKGDYGEYEIKITFEKESTEIEAGHRIIFTGKLVIDQIIDETLSSIQEALQSQEDLYSSDDNQSLLQALWASKDYVEPKLQIESFNKDNILNITFTKPMLIVDTPVINIDEQVFEIYIESDFDYYDYFGMVTKWKTEEMTENYLLIRVELQNEDQISVFENPDRLRVNVLEKKFFMTQSPNEYLTGDWNPSIELESRLYYDTAASVKLLEVGKVIEKGGWVAFIINFLMKILMQSTLQLLFSLMNTLQLLVHLPLIKSSFPPKTIQFLAVFQSLSQFDCLPTDQINPFFFDFFEESDITREQLRSGYGDNNYILNSGSVYWFIVFYIVGVIIFSPVFLLTKRLKEKKLFKKLGGFLFFSFLIGLLLEGYLELAFGSLIQIKAYQKENRSNSDIKSVSGELGSAISVLITLVALFFFVISTSVVLVFKQKKFKDDKFQDRFGDLVDGLKEERLAMMYPVFFILRRTLFVIAIYFAPDNAGIQVISLSSCTTFFIIYLFYAMPREEKHFNSMEILNEIITKVMEYFIIGFTDFSPNPEVKQNMTAYFMGVIGLTICFNLVYLVQQTIVNPILKERRIKKLRQQIARLVAQGNQSIRQISHQMSFGSENKEQSQDNRQDQNGNPKDNIDFDSLSKKTDQNQTKSKPKNQIKSKLFTPQQKGGMKGILNLQKDQFILRDHQKKADLKKEQDPVSQKVYQEEEKNQKVAKPLKKRINPLKNLQKKKLLGQNKKKTFKPKNKLQQKQKTDLNESQRKLVPQLQPALSLKKKNQARKAAYQDPSVEILEFQESPQNDDGDSEFNMGDLQTFDPMNQLKGWKKQKLRM